MALPLWHRRTSQASKRPPSPRRFRPRLEGLEGRLLPATYLVTNGNDSGPGSLRQAILDSNGSPGLNTIAFDMADSGVQTIRPASALPTITNPVVIGGTTEPGHQGTPLVVLSGAGAGQAAVGLSLTTTDSVVKGLVVSSFSQPGITFSSAAANDVVEGNFIGTDSTGFTSAPNRTGVEIDTGAIGITIGGTVAGAGNLISGNVGSGISLAGGASLIAGNTIGLTVRGNASLSNSSDGVYVTGPGNTIGGLTAAARNVISGNPHVAVLLTSCSGNAVEGNYLGTDVTGTVAIGNYNGEAFSMADNNIIGGTAPGAGNLISGDSEGIEINNSRNNLFEGNLIGTDVSGTRVLHYGSGIVAYGGAQNTIGGTGVGARNVISGYSNLGINFSSGNLNVIEGNYIGTDVTGMRALGNAGGVIFAYGSADNTVGGIAAAARNIISGNTGTGVNFYSGGNTVQGNYIGTDVTGTRALANQGDGVGFSAGLANLIGGDTPGAGNLLSGNVGHGIAGGSGSIIQGNLIGTDVTGTVPLPNGSGGIQLDGGSFNTVGGIGAGARNLISGNQQYGIFIQTRGNVIQGNYIGTDITGTRALGNGSQGLGVRVNNEASNLIGGTVPGAGNLISGNSGTGVDVEFPASNTLIQGNRIGTDASGTQALPNGQGVVINAGNTTVGGTASGGRNVISGNVNEGVVANAGATAIFIQGNFIGTDASSTRALGNATGVSISGTSNVTVGGTTAAARNVISGNNSVGVRIAGTSMVVEGNFIGTTSSGTAALGNLGAGVSVLDMADTIGGTAAGAGNVISGNGGPGVAVSGSVNRTAVQGNLIGTDPTGSLPVPNAEGMDISGQATNNTIGGTTAAARNVISGNTGAGVNLSANGNLIEGNYVGTDVTGANPLPNQTGIISAASNIVGGTALGAGNLISANTQDGLDLTGGSSFVQGNFIGTDATGTLPLGNDRGIGLLLVSGNVIGGTTAGSGNVISGNLSAGVYTAAVANQVQRNFIGTDGTGTLAVPNADGVLLASPATGNTIGGTTTAARNLISGNTSSGVDIQASQNIIQGNYVGTDRSGLQSLPNGTGITVDGSSNTIGGTAVGAGNLISGNAVDGVDISAGQSGNQLLGNRIGTDSTGEAPLANAANGVMVSGPLNTVGGTAAGAGNLIAGNDGSGILLVAGGNVVQGNLIGTDAAGATSLANLVGVDVEGADETIGGMTAGARNVMSGNQGEGVVLLSGGNLVQGNYVGTDVTGTAAVPNSDGVSLAADGNTVGGTTAGAGNVIAGNRSAGVRIQGADNLVQGNRIGTDPSGTAALGNTLGVSIDSGSDNTIGGTTAGASNLIAARGSDGVYITSPGNVVQGNRIGTDASGTLALGNAADGVHLVNASDNTIGGVDPGAGNLISGNAQAGIHIAFIGSQNNLMAGNWIGTDATGAAALANGEGVFISDALGNTIGSITTGARNVISGNAGFGVEIANSAQGNVVEGNYIGTDATGTLPLGNATDGVHIHFATTNNTIGGTQAGAGNRISGNLNAGVAIGGADARDNVIEGNFIGTDVTGTQSLGNGTDGVLFSNAAGDTVGGTAPGAGNLISGNTNFGVDLAFGDAQQDVIQGNRIGTDVTGMLALGIGDVFNNTVGGTTVGARNVISGNIGDGIQIFSSSQGNLVEGNFIGTDVTGSAALGNGGNGVLIQNASDNTVGGTAAGAGNRIGNNGNDGVLVDTGTGNAIRQNAIFNSGNLGIELLNGSNNDQAAPVLTSAVSDGGLTYIEGTVHGAPNTALTVEIFVNAVCNLSEFGEGERFLGSTTVTTDDSGNGSFTLIVAVAVDPG
jgi:hypothetical protein